MEKKKIINENEAVDRLPGAAIDVADDEKVTEAEVKERVKTENNNRGSDYSEIK